jgi:uncharacterized membrane protein YfcA
MPDFPMPDFPMIGDPWFYAAALPAVLIVGLSKGGFGPGTGLIALPLLSLMLPPLQAAAIMLPVLCAMDLAGLWGFRGKWDRQLMPVILAGGLCGIAIGTATARWVDDRAILLIVGAVAILFPLHRWFGRISDQPAPRSTAKGLFWSAASGFTSFIAHAGNPPLMVYMVPLRLDKTVFMGTTVIFYAVINYAKLLPYWWLGQLSFGNVATSAALIPVAVGGVYLGLWLHRKLSDAVFYRIVNIVTLLCGVKLFADGLGLSFR